MLSCPNCGTTIEQDRFLVDQTTSGLQSYSIVDETSEGLVLKALDYQVTGHPLSFTIHCASCGNAWVSQRRIADRQGPS